MSHQKMIQQSIQRKTAMTNEICWVPENIVRQDGAPIGEDESPQVYKASVRNISFQKSILSFDVDRHSDQVGSNYAYRVFLNDQTRTGWYEQTEPRVYRGLIPTWRRYGDIHRIMIFGLWNEYSGRNTNPMAAGTPDPSLDPIPAHSTQFLTWPENWDFYIELELPTR